jgi:AGZA family xanthine/uracil permease-like MFS transporter
VVVGFLMFSIASEFQWGELDEMFPVLATLIVMPLTFTITNGIAAGFISYVFLKVVRGRAAEIHPLLWIVTIGFVIFFAVPWLQSAISPPPPA